MTYYMFARHEVRAPGTVPVEMGAEAEADGITWVGHRFGARGPDDRFTLLVLQGGELRHPHVTHVCPLAVREAVVELLGVRHYVNPAWL